jgi:hypothetical protein
MNQLIFEKVKSCVFFAVRTGFLNINQTSLSFKGLSKVGSAVGPDPSLSPTECLKELIASDIESGLEEW